MWLRYGLFLRGKIWNDCVKGPDSISIAGKTGPVFCTGDVRISCPISREIRSERQPEILIVNPNQAYNKEDQKEQELEETTSFTTVIWDFHLVL